MQEAGDGSSDHAGEHRHDDGERGVHAAHDEHGAHASAEREAAVDGKVCDVEQLVGNEDAEDHDAPEDALRYGAKHGECHTISSNLSLYARRAARIR